MGSAAIPPLWQFRGGRGSRRQPGQSPSTLSERPGHPNGRDQVVLQTDDDASTFVRTIVIDRLVQDFLDQKSTKPKQIISLGAGTDTRYFRLKLRRSDFIYHEIDMAYNTRRKITTIMQTPELKALLGPDDCIALSSSNPRPWPRPEEPAEPAEPADSLSALDYYIHALDLRSLNFDEKSNPISLHAIDPSLPTLILSECCLVYLTPAEADRAVCYLTRHVLSSSPAVGLIIYEPVNPYDAFGKVMVSNLSSRGIELRTLQKYGSLEAQQARLKLYNLSHAHACDIKRIWEITIDEEEKARIANLEMVDEIEEWDLLAAHYCIAWGWRILGDTESDVQDSNAFHNWSTLLPG